MYSDNPPIKFRSSEKVNLSLRLIKRHAMKTHVEEEVQLHTFSSSVLDGGEWSASRLGFFTSGERAPGYPLDRNSIGGGKHLWLCACSVGV
jgi:hypothetical protein